MGQGYVFTGVCDSVHRGEYLTRYTPRPGTPPQTRYTRCPLDQVHPQTRCPPGPGAPPDQVHPSPDQVHPPNQVYPPGPGDQVHPPDQVHPRDQVHPPDQVPHPPWTRYTPRPGTPSPWTRYTPQDQVPPPRGTACWEIRSTSGRYASYWNAILFRLTIEIDLAVVWASLFYEEWIMLSQSTFS